MRPISLETVFSFANAVAMCGWLLLLFVPLKHTLPRTLAGVLAIPLAMLYAALIGAFWTGASGGFGSLSAVAQLFEHPGVLLAGWVHYLAFDLLVGAWERDQARRIGLSQWLLAPCLLLTFLFGPLGWLAFLGVRAIRRRSEVFTAAAIS